MTIALIILRVSHYWTHKIIIVTRCHYRSPERKPISCISVGYSMDRLNVIETSQITAVELDCLASAFLSSKHALMASALRIYADRPCSLASQWDQTSLRKIFNEFFQVFAIGLVYYDDLSQAEKTFDGIFKKHAAMEIHHHHYTEFCRTMIACLGDIMCFPSSFYYKFAVEALEQLNLHFAFTYACDATPKVLN